MGYWYCKAKIKDCKKINVDGGLFGSKEKMVTTSKLVEGKVLGITADDCWKNIIVVTEEGKAPVLETVCLKLYEFESESPVDELLELKWVK
jgi:predicted RNA-binding protein